MPGEVFAQVADPDQKPAPFLQSDDLKDDQDSSVEPDPSTPSQQIPPDDSQVILEKSQESEEKNPQEGIGDVFSKNQGDRFQSKNNKKVEFMPVK